MSDLKFHPDALVLSWPSLDLDPAYTNVCSGLDLAILNQHTKYARTVHGATIKVKKPDYVCKIEFENGAGI